MKKETLRKLAFSIAIPAMALASCGDDNDNNNNGDEPNVNPDPTETVDGLLTSTEAFDYLKSTASEAISLFNPEDQREILQACKNFDELYGDFDMPEEFEDDDYDSPGYYVKALEKAMGNGSPLDMTRAYYTYSIKDYTGVYEPNLRTHCWERTGNSNDVVFLCKVNGQDFEIKAAPSDGTWVLELDDNYEIPLSVTTTLTYGGQQLASTVVESRYDQRGHTAALKISAQAANIAVTTDLNGTDSQLTERAYATVGGKRLIDATMTVRGNHLCDMDAYASLENAGPAQLEAMFQSATFSVNILDRVFFNGSGSNIVKVTNALGFEGDRYDGDQKELLKECRKACNVIEDNISAEVKFAGSNEVQGRLVFQPYLYDESSSYWRVYPAPGIEYAYDKSIEVFEDTDYDFSVVEAQFRNLLERYRNFYNRLR